MSLDVPTDLWGPLMDGAGEAQRGTATPGAALAAGAAPAHPCLGFASPCPALPTRRWYLSIDSLGYFSVLPGPALKAHVEMLEQPF